MKPEREGKKGEVATREEPSRAPVNVFFLIVLLAELGLVANYFFLWWPR
jgi:hypothetical protein